MTLPQKFEEYLVKSNFSKTTSKNYLSDLNNYFDWFLKETGVDPLLQKDSFLKKHNLKLLKKYRAWLRQENISNSTIRRRFATLKKFDEFASGESLKYKSPAKKIKTKKQINVLLEFKKELERENANPTTAKNYLSDVSQFLNWLEEN